MSDNIIVLPRDDVAALLAAIADLEDRELRTPHVFATVERDAIATLSRIASDIDQQVSTQ